MGFLDLVRNVLLRNRMLDVVAVQMCFLDTPGLAVTREGEELVIGYMDPNTGRLGRARIRMQNDQVRYGDLLEALAATGYRGPDE